QLVGGNRRLRAADELARVRDATERSDAWRLERQPVIHLERLPVAPQVEEGVAERAVGRAVLGIEPNRPPREAEAVPEPVPRVRERRLALDDQRQRSAGVRTAWVRGVRNPAV